MFWLKLILLSACFLQCFSFIRRHACNGNFPKRDPIKCYGNRRINIISAKYGRFGPNQKKICFVIPQLIKMKTCQDDVTEKMREICNGQSECNPNAMKDQILDPNRCAKWNNLLLSRRYYFEVDFECKEDLQICNGCKDGLKKDVSCTNGRKIHVKSANIIMVREGQEFEVSNSDCTYSVTKNLRHLKNGKSETTFHQLEHMWGDYDHAAYSERQTCDIFHGFKMKYCCQTSSGSLISGTCKTISYIENIDSARPRVICRRGSARSMGKRNQAFTVEGSKWQETYTNVKEMVCNVDADAGQTCFYKQPLLLEYTCEEH
eukprot:TCONS_00009526-protein